MRIVNTGGAAGAAAEGRVSAFGLPASLGEGDVLEARVLSAGDGSAVLKTEDGRIFHAKLEGGAALREGENVSLLVEGSENGVITLAIVREGDVQARQGDGASYGPVAAGTRGESVTLADMAARLETLGLPSGESTAARALAFAHGGLAPDEAVFLASQGAADTPDMIRAARFLLSGGAKLDTLLSELLVFLENAAAPYGQPASGTLIFAGDTEITPENKTPIQTAGIPEEKTRIPELAFFPAENTEPPVSKEAPPAESAELSADAELAVSVEPNNAERAVGNARIDVSGLPMPETESFSAATRAAPENVVVSAGGAREMPENAEASAESAAGSGVRTLSGGGGAVNTAVPDETSELSKAIESLFVKIDREGRESIAVRLRQAREELPVRAAQLAEYAARAGSPDAEAIADRAGKIIDQARLANATEQYVYTQLPIVISGERRAAELYVFKRKRSAISKDDANILLSLDLPALGHWEALVNVRGRDVSLQMRASSEDTREHLSGSTARLHDILSEAGYRLTGARVTIAGDGAEAKTTPLTACAAFPRGREGAGIDVVV